jgi:Archaeal ATPase.
MQAYSMSLRKLNENYKLEHAATNKFYENNRLFFQTIFSMRDNNRFDAFAQMGQANELMGYIDNQNDCLLFLCGFKGIGKSSLCKNTKQELLKRSNSHVIYIDLDRHADDYSGFWQNESMAQQEALIQARKHLTSYILNHVKEAYPGQETGVNRHLALCSDLFNFINNKNADVFITDIFTISNSEEQIQTIRQGFQGERQYSYALAALKYMLYTEAEKKKFPQLVIIVDNCDCTHIEYSRAFISELSHAITCIKQLRINQPELEIGSIKAIFSCRTDVYNRLYEDQYISPLGIHEVGEVFIDVPCSIAEILQERTTKWGILSKPITESINLTNFLLEVSDSINRTATGRILTRLCNNDLSIALPIMKDLISNQTFMKIDEFVESGGKRNTSDENPVWNNAELLNSIAYGNPKEGNEKTYFFASTDHSEQDSVISNVFSSDSNIDKTFLLTVRIIQLLIEDQKRRSGMAGESIIAVMRKISKILWNEDILDNESAIWQSLKYLYECKFINTHSNGIPQNMNDRIFLLPKAEETFKLMETRSLLLEYFVDDTWLPPTFFKSLGGNEDYSGACSIRNRFKKIAHFFSFIVAKECEEITRINKWDGISLFAYSFGSSLFSSMVFEGIKKDFDNFYKYSFEIKKTIGKEDFYKIELDLDKIQSEVKSLEKLFRKNMVS